jgi:cytochrome c-type protein NapC
MVTVLSAIALGSAALAAVILIGFLVRRGPVDGLTKALLLLGIGVLPLVAAMSGNVVGLEQMKERQFCGSCHEMTPYVRDASNPRGTSTAALHSRNEHFGQESCYTCHRDYSMYGGVVTKLDGMKHVWVHYLQGGPKKPLATYRPYQNALCQRCHSTTAPNWLRVEPHREALANIRENGLSCVRSSCHGPVHDVKGATDGDAPGSAPATEVSP